MDENLSESLDALRGIIKEFYDLAEYEPKKAREYNQMDLCSLDKGTHAQFALNNMLALNRGYQSVDSGQPWLPYWLTNILEVTSTPLDDLPKVMKEKLTKYLNYLHNFEEGGFRGARSFQSHVASTYAAIMAIVNIGSKSAYDILRGKKELMREFLKSVFTKEPQIQSQDLKASEIKVGEKGAYILHENGEYDLRGCYCALVVADILGLLPDEDLTEGMGDFIASCQTYEGGIACNPFGEAHAGYTYCGLA